MAQLENFGTITLSGAFLSALILLKLVSIFVKYQYCEAGDQKLNQLNYEQIQSHRKKLNVCRAEVNQFIYVGFDGQFLLVNRFGAALTNFVFVQDDFLRLGVASSCCELMSPGDAQVWWQLVQSLELVQPKLLQKQLFHLAIILVDILFLVAQFVIHSQ